MNSSQLDGWGCPARRKFEFALSDVRRRIGSQFRHEVVVYETMNRNFDQVGDFVFPNVDRKL